MLCVCYWCVVSGLEVKLLLGPPFAGVWRPKPRPTNEKCRPKVAVSAQILCWFTASFCFYWSAPCLSKWWPVIFLFFSSFVRRRDLIGRCVPCHTAAILFRFFFQKKNIQLESFFVTECKHVRFECWHRQVHVHRIRSSAAVTAGACRPLGPAMEKTTAATEATRRWKFVRVIHSDLNLNFKNITTLCLVKISSGTGHGRQMSLVNQADYIFE